MKNRILKSVVVFFVVLSVLIVFTGCSGRRELIGLPDTVTELDGKIKQNCITAGTTKANLYFDNTQSMYGYICSNTGETSLFTISVNNLIDIIEGYNSYSINALVANSSNILEWNSMEASSFSRFMEKDFYTFKGSFNRNNGEYGPLQTLIDHKETPVNFDELNIFITDLAEQELNNKQLAEKINDVVLNREDHSVALYCIESRFSGRASVPVPGVTENDRTDMLSDNYDGKRPFYCLIVGPTIEVVSICNEVDDSFKSADLAEGQDFNSVRILSKRGLQYSPMHRENTVVNVFDDFYVDEDNKYNDYEMYQAGLSFANTNLNFNINAINYDQMFMVSEELPGQCYVYDNQLSSLDQSTFGNAAINFLIPLSNLSDGTPANIDEIEYKLINEEGLFTVYGCKEEEVTTIDDQGQEQTITKEAWEEISYFDLFKKTNSYMNMPELDVLAKGETIKRVSDYDDNEELKYEEYPVGNIDLYTVENESGALKVKLSFNNIDELAEKYSCITIAFRIDASRRMNENVPQWINDYNLPDKSAGNPSLAFSKTTKLQEFYTFLVGKMSSAQERAEFESHMTKTVTDVVVNVHLHPDELDIY